MFDVLLAEAGGPGHLADALFVQRYKAARMRAHLDRLLCSITVSGTGLPSDARTDWLGRMCGHGDPGRRTRLSGCYESPPTWRRS
ncbi:hypothetical protein [Streptomyces sp. NPDC096311]|uniref:hypothetical protein n=1 Tax=Streptomyces sp. NPDC096311 TaxID=3366083 RepID=UPI003818C915